MRSRLLTNRREEHRSLVLGFGKFAVFSNSGSLQVSSMASFLALAVTVEG